MAGNELEGKTALVAGSAGSIGRACAAALSAAGADVVLSYNRHKQEALELVRELQDQGRRVMAFQGDVSNSAEVSNLFLMAEQHFGGVDILVNDAGPYARKHLCDLSDAEWEDIVEPNLYGVFYCCREAIPYMREKSWGRIINITLEAAEDPEAASNIGPYAIARVGIVALTKTLALEEALHGITVNAVGPVLADPEEDVAVNGALHAEPRLRLARPEELARAVLFLASPRSDSINGAHLALSDVWQP